MGENPSALAQSVVWTDRTASKTALRVSLLQQALAVGTKGGRHAAACRLRDFGGGGASRCSCALCLGVAAGQPDKERVREYCGTLLMASAWLASGNGWKWEREREWTKMRRKPGLQSLQAQQSLHGLQKVRRAVRSCVDSVERNNGSCRRQQGKAGGGGGG